MKKKPSNTDVKFQERDIILDSITDGVFTVDKDWRITSFNRAAETITGIDRVDAVGKLCSYVFRASICETGCALRCTMETGKSINNRAIYIIRADGVKAPVSISTAILRDNRGSIIGGVETFRDLSMEEELKRELHKSYSFSDIISRNHRMNEIFTLIPAIAESLSTVLVEGESGTGKELVCRAIHNNSLRKNGPFVAVNCGALPDTLLASELFGYTAGAFTDARKDKKGRVALAENGTLLLDEIGDITPALQVSLLRLLQEKEYTPLGSEKSVRANVRILAATNKNLHKLVEKNEFRQDMYYRINVMKMFIPPLRERKEDIQLLVEHFLHHFNKITGKQVKGVSDSSMAALMNHDYPGNIRELENAIEHAFVLCKGETIMPVHLPEQFSLTDTNPHFSPGETLHDMEINAIMSALERNSFNRLAAARELGIHKSTLHRKVKKLGLDLPNIDGRSSS